MPLLGCCCCCCGPRRAEVGSPRTAWNGPPPSRGSPGQPRCVGGRGPVGCSRGSSRHGSRRRSQNCSRGRGRRTPHPQGAHDSGQGVGPTPVTARTELTHPFLDPRSRRFPGGGAVGTSRPRVPKTWMRERATAVRQIIMSSHRSMHPQGRTRGGRAGACPNRRGLLLDAGGTAHTYTQGRRVDGRPPPFAVCWSQCNR
jgi:hypothetical protein